MSYTNTNKIKMTFTTSDKLLVMLQFPAALKRVIYKDSQSDAPNEVP